MRSNSGKTGPAAVETEKSGQIREIHEDTIEELIVMLAGEGCRVKTRLNGQVEQNQCVKRHWILDMPWE